MWLITTYGLSCTRVEQPDLGLLGIVLTQIAIVFLYGIAERLLVGTELNIENFYNAIDEVRIREILDL